MNAKELVETTTWEADDYLCLLKTPEGKTIVGCKSMMKISAEFDEVTFRKWIEDEISKRVKDRESLPFLEVVEATISKDDPRIAEFSK